MKARRSLSLRAPCAPSLLLLIAACGSSHSGATGRSDGGTEPGVDGGSGSDELIGSFSIRLVAPSPATATSPAVAGFTSLNGKVYDGPTPQSVAWDEVASADGCVLSKPRVPFCDPGCGADVCVDENTCQPNPRVRSVGTVHVTGLVTDSGKRAFDVEQVGGSYVNAASVKLPYPAFDEGASIRLETSGGDFAPFVLEAKGIAPLEVSDGSTLSLATGNPVKLQWTPPHASGASRVSVKLDISHHGGTKGKSECDVDDDGEHTIDSSLVSQLVDLGVAGFPTIVVTRGSLGSAQLAEGRVALSVYSSVELAVDVPGVVSCTSDDECPDSQTCQTDLTCR